VEMIIETRFDRWLNSETTRPRGRVYDDAPPNRAVGAFMSLLEHDLRSKSNADLRATVREIHIEEEANALHVMIKCAGALWDSDKLRDLANSAGRSMRGALRTLCESVGQQNPLLIRATAPDEIQRIRTELQYSHLIIGVGKNDTVFSISWPRNAPPAQPQGRT
jgi:hypothetical protein